MTFYNKDISEIFKIFHSSNDGLTTNQATLNKQEFGSNEPEKQKRDSFFKKFLLQFKNIMIIILLVSAIISCVTAVLESEPESLFEGILIFAIVIINAIVGVIQEQKAENALLALKKQTTPFSKIYRDGTLQKISINDIVVGDIISLKAGDYIPADIRIITSNGLKCDESSLTGESHDIEKNEKIVKNKSSALSSQKNICFSGTTVKSGTATGIVVAVGEKTEFGKIAKSLNSSQKEKTPLEKNIDKIGKFITIFVLIVAIVVFLIQCIFNKNISTIDALLTAVALAVAAIPESLPAVITIILALGVQKLAKQNAIVKKLSAVETLGCCNIICTDKTGTLTENKMSVAHVCFSNQIFDSKNLDLSSIEQILNICSICNSFDAKTGLGGDATEKALLEFLVKNNVDIKSISSSYQILKKNDFNSTKKTMSVLAQNNNKNFLMVKGALDYILPKCTHCLIDNSVQELTEKNKQKISICNESICEKGERVLAFAIKENADSDEESNLTFIGFVGIIDPPRKEVFEAIKQNKKAGIKTIMITGDHPITAFAIAKTLGISKNKNEVLTGKDIDSLSEKDFSNVIQNYTVFARVSPEHKLKIIKALKKNKNIVAMTGDGVNDAPSVKNANIGVCMGKTGTDVTKEVADIIISDDNYLTIISSIKQGRTIYQNIEKTILFLLSTNIVEVLGIFITALILPNQVFLLPTQILFINLVTDSLPAFALGIEDSPKDIMSSPPRNSEKSLLSGVTGSRIIYQGFIQTLVILVMFVSATHKFGGEVATTMSFLTICLMQIIHAINCKTTKSIFKINILKNHFFNFSFLFLLGLIFAIYFITPLASLFSLCALSLSQWLIVIFTSIMIIPAVELGKIFIKG